MTSDDKKCPECGWSAEDVNQLTAEIERLTAELANARELIAHAIGGEPKLEALQAERDRLLKATSPIHAHVDMLRAENDRLRAALERLQKDARSVNWRPQEFRDHVQQVTREALALNYGRTGPT